MKTILNKLAPIMLIAALLVSCCAVGACAEEADTAEYNANGITFTYTPSFFNVTEDEDGTVSGVSAEEMPEYVGFDIVHSEGTDAQAYMTEAADSYSLELDEGTCFGEEKDWYSFQQEVTEGDSVTYRSVYARPCEDGAWIVTFYSYKEPDEDRAMQISDELAAVADTLVLAD